MEKKTIKSFLSIIKKMNLNKVKYYESGYQELITRFKFKIYPSRKKIIEIDTKKDYHDIKETISFDKSYTC